MQKWAKKMNKREKVNLTAIARALIVVISIGHLIFTSVHVKALLLLENEICGFVMFLFVLFGLVALFESTRIKQEQLQEWLITSVMCFITVGFGGYLVSIYRSAIATQKSLEPGLVIRAANFSMVIMAVFAVAGVLLLMDFIRGLRR